MSDQDRGRPAGFDPETGEVSGSGAGAGGGNAGEDYDRDPMAGSGAKPPHRPRPADRVEGSQTAGGTGHPLPAGEEARHGEIPEGMAEEKGLGDDPRPAERPQSEAVDPDGEPYPV